MPTRKLVPPPIINSNHEQRGTGDFPPWLIGVCGLSAIAVAILLALIILNQRRAQFAQIVAEANAKAREHAKAGEQALESGDLEQANTFLNQARDVRYSKEMTLIDSLQSKIANEAKRRETIIEAARVAAEQQANEAKRAAEAQERAVKEEQFRQRHQRQIAEKNAEAAELAKLNQWQKSTWNSLETLLREIHDKIDSESRTLQLTRKVMEKEPGS